MTDFVDALEAELVAAARRRAEGGRSRRRRSRFCLAPALAAVMLIVAAVAGVRALDSGPPPADEAAVPPGGGVRVTLPAAAPAAGCPPAHAAEDTGVYLLAADRMRACAAAWERDDLCLVAGVRRLMRCFTRAEIDAGRAVALTGDETVHGIVPEGVGAVTVEWGGREATAAPNEGAYELRLPGVSEGDELRVRLVSPQPRCAPSEQLLEAVPALALPAGAAPDPVVGERMAAEGAHGAWRRHARLAMAEPRVWVMPNLACDNPHEQGESACVAMVTDPLGFVCGRAEEIRTHGTWILFPTGGDRLALAGLAPEGAGRVDVTIDGGDLEALDIENGVFAAILPEAFGASVDPGESAGDIDVSFRSGGDAHGPL